MRKKHIIIIAITLSLVLPMIYFWPAIKVLTGGNASYTERDEEYYQLLTDDIIKKCPRISENYEFAYATVDGPAIEVSSVTFHGSNDVQSIRNYLNSIGFIFNRAEDNGEYWISDKTKKNVFIWSTNNPKTTIIQVLDKME